MFATDWKRIHAESVVFDLHIHPSMQQELFHRNLNWRYAIKRAVFRHSPLTVRASFPRLRDGGYDVFFSAVHIPEKGLRKDFPILNLLQYAEPELWHRLMEAYPYIATLAAIADFEEAAAQSDVPGQRKVQVAKSVAEVDAILQKPKETRPILAIHTIEGGHSLEGPSQTEGIQPTDDELIANLEELFDHGVASLILAHFYPNRLVNPCYPFPEDIANVAANPSIWRDLTHGLTPLGVRVVERMIELGMLIDMSHSTPVARQQIYDIADASGKRVPLLVTHVGAYTVNPSPYNLSDWEIRRIARDGGVIGVIFMPYWLMPKESGQGINFISRHIQYLMDVGGEDVVGIGTDFDGFTTPPDDLDNASQMPRLTQRLCVDGYSEQQIKKILGGNALRALCDGWGKQT
jgi:microsomal dipeptidase-like Zn-dependent dipeptidase